MVQIRVLQDDILNVEADTCIVNVFADVTKPQGATGAVDAACRGYISHLLEGGQCTGTLGDIEIFHTPDLQVKTVLVVGLGKKEDFTLERARIAAGNAIKAARKKGKTAATIVHGAGVGGLAMEECARALVEGTLMGAYTFSPFQSKVEESTLKELLIVEREEEKVAQLEKGLELGLAMGRGVNLARDLVNMPANYMTPMIMAERAREVARNTGMECVVFEKDQLEEKGMGCLLGVARGSQEVPCLIQLRYEGDPGGPDLALVGKGLTFDSGGISLKPGQGMEAMKSDMGGAAAVLGAMEVLATIKPKRNVTAFLGCTENLPSGTALKPGDVLKACNGKTIEIINTDAEGRLVLADCVAYAHARGCNPIIDVATLTGACVVALGKNIYSGMVANNQTVANAVLSAGEDAGERIWQFPTADEYKELYKSDVADMKNVGTREGGAITGGLIIGEFVGNGDWVHLDIAPTCMTTKDKGYERKGATGVGVRTLVQYVLNGA